jgi:hypothetical protein
VSRAGIAAGIGVAAAVALVALALVVPLELRHSAPFGFRLTFDGERGIAVRGGTVVANYPDFNRLDLDLRAYTPGASYDLTVHVRPDEPGAADVRTIPLGLEAEEIWHDKPTFADPFLTVRFPPIPDSAGKRYLVWVDPGPRNRDEVVALWSIKSYSRLTGRDALAAFLADPPGDGGETWARAALVAVMVGVVLAFGALMAALAALALSVAARPTGGFPERWWRWRPPLAGGIQ